MSERRDRSEEASARMTTVFTSAIGVPIDSEGLEEGCNRMPAALRTQRPHRGARGARPAATSQAGPVRGTRDPLTGVRGPAEVAAVSLRLRDALLPLLRFGERPLVVGGCCAVLLGAGLAVREVAGRAGLAFVDGHEDFYDGQSSLSGCVADMELAIVTGHGPAGLLPDVPAAPLFRDVDAVALGVRDSAIARRTGRPTRAAWRPACASSSRRASSPRAPGTPGSAWPPSSPPTPGASGCTSTST